MPPSPALVLTRRNFLRLLGVGAGAIAGQALPLARLHPWRRGARPATRLALIGDSHLMAPAHNARFAQRLARTLQAIATLRPAVDAVLFTGNLAHMGEPQALALGRRLLDTLDAPLVVAAGAHDWHRDDGDSYTAHFGAANSMQRIGNIVVLKLMAAWVPHIDGVGAQPLARMQALAVPDDPRPARFVLQDGALSLVHDAVAQLLPEDDVVVLTHTPQYDYFAPWNFCNRSAASLQDALKDVRRKTFVHGQVQHPLMHVGPAGVHLSAPSTAWSWPYPPADAHYAQHARHAGCGFAVLTLGAQPNVRCEYYLNQAAPHVPTLSLDALHPLTA